MKKIYERPALVKKGNLKRLTAATNGAAVSPPVTPQ
ncbi:lasso RiPP family leader peptide-containing protein [Mesorhizobium sp. NZP2077]|nr:lasso RiPP family leader peptide-containing protein [Mesorhizobium sp. NZP2077]QKC82738.1 lasso RiPP family leader peptide-containing protein [Mesorhizobium sp. NZP2077]QKD16234.1 lasso RiPP family leader peptide-containing protein [Mesorhizobium sp. NZP2077]